MIIDDDSSVISKWSFKLIDNPRVIIYDHHRFIIQATGVPTEKNTAVKVEQPMSAYPYFAPDSVCISCLYSFTLDLIDII